MTIYISCVDAHLLSITLQFVYLVFLLKKKKKLNKSVKAIIRMKGKSKFNLRKATGTPDSIY